MRRTILLFYVSMVVPIYSQTSLPMIDGYKSFKWNTPLQAVEDKLTETKMPTGFPDSLHWFYMDSGKRIGPTTTDSITLLVTQGKIGPDSLIWHDGFTDWKKANETEFSLYFKSSNGKASLSVSNISSDSLISTDNSPLERMLGSEIYSGLQLLETSAVEDNQEKKFTYIFCDSLLVALKYTNETANPDDVVQALSSKYGTPRKTVLIDTVVLGFKTKSTMYEWKGQKGTIRAQSIIADGRALYDNYMAQQADQMGASEYEMQMATALMAQQRNQLMKVSVDGPMYVSNTFVQKQKSLSKTSKPKLTPQKQKPRIQDDF